MATTGLDVSILSLIHCSSNPSYLNSEDSNSGVAAGVGVAVAVAVADVDGVGVAVAVDVAGLPDGVGVEELPELSGVFLLSSAFVTVTLQVSFFLAAAGAEGSAAPKSMAAVSR